MTPVEHFRTVLHSLADGKPLPDLSADWLLNGLIRHVRGEPLESALALTPANRRKPGIMRSWPLLRAWGRLTANGTGLYCCKRLSLDLKAGFGQKSAMKPTQICHPSTQRYSERLPVAHAPYDPPAACMN